MIEAQREWKATWPAQMFIASILILYVQYLLGKYSPRLISYTNSSMKNDDGYILGGMLMFGSVALQALVELKVLYW